MRAALINLQSLTPASRPTHVTELIECNPKLTGNLRSVNCPSRWTLGRLQATCNRRSGELSGPKMWWNCAAQRSSPIWTQRWQQSSFNVQWPNKLAPWTAVITQPSGPTTPHPRAGLPKQQTKPPPNLLASSFEHWPCVVSAQRDLPSPL